MAKVPESGPVVNLGDNSGEENVDFTCSYQDLHSLTHHKENGSPLYPPYPENTEIIYLGMGCFWGAERLFWETDGVFVTMVGFMGGHLHNPMYEDVCTGESGHTEAVKVVYRPNCLSVNEIVDLFIDNSSVKFEMRHYNNEAKKRRLQYASKIWCTSQNQLLQVQSMLIDKLDLASEFADDQLSSVCCMAPCNFYPAEDRHQQYLAGRGKKRFYQCPRI